MSQFSVVTKVCVLSYISDEVNVKTVGNLIVFANVKCTSHATILAHDSAVADVSLLADIS